MIRGKLLRGMLGVVFAVAVIATTIPSTTHAADATQPADFNLQVTPSPLVTTLKPGTKTTAELKIHNGGTGTENLKIEPRSFKLEDDSTNVNLLDTTPPDIGNWVSFSQSKFSLQPGQWITQQVIFTVPKNAGFSYSFALVISRQSDPTPTGGQRLLKGSVAIFTLVNVDRPDATSSLEVASFGSSKNLYEYLPATFDVKFRNSGNTITQPYGNIFIGREEGDTPIGTLKVNENHGYILPDTTRTITATWDDGFPAYQTVQNSDGTTSQKAVWNWTKLSSLRIGRYTAHLVAVYNQGGRDIPIEGNVTFWVVPWKILLVLLVIALLILFALFMLVRSIVRGIKHRHTKRMQKKAAKNQSTTPPPSDSSDS